MTGLAGTRLDLLRRGLRLEYLTVGWNIAEGLIAVGAGLAAGSIALIGFGVDSFVETISGLVLIWRLSAEARGRLDEEAVERVERRAERLVGMAFLLLAAYVGFEAIRSLAEAGGARRESGRHRLDGCLHRSDALARSREATDG